MQTQFRQIEAMRNPIAASLRSGACRKQIVRSKKGKGSFRRADKHRGRAFA